jgi:hypothetical protein
MAIELNAALRLQATEVTAAPMFKEEVKRDTSAVAEQMKAWNPSRQVALGPENQYVYYEETDLSTVITNSGNTLPMVVIKKGGIL